MQVDPVVAERLLDGEEITTTRRGSRRVSDQAATYKVNDRITRDSTLVRWKSKVARSFQHENKSDAFRHLSTAARYAGADVSPGR